MKSAARYAGRPAGRWIVVAVVAAASLVSTTGAWAHPKSGKQTTTEVRGGYVNDAGFIPTGATPTKDPDVYTVTFTGGSTWDGDFTGHTVVTGVAKMNIKTFALSADYTETLYGTYYPDLEKSLEKSQSPRTGSLTVKGHAEVTHDGEFTALATIVGGTCAFAGSSGSITYDGSSYNGGYVGSWTRPAGAAPDAACVPITTGG